MNRYILVDNITGHIVGDSANLDGQVFDGTPDEFAEAVDTVAGRGGRFYIHTRRHCLTAGRPGYHVYEAGPLVPVVIDGSDKETIETVEFACSYAATLRWVV